MGAQDPKRRKKGVRWAPRGRPEGTHGGSKNEVKNQSQNDVKNDALAGSQGSPKWPKPYFQNRLFAPRALPWDPPGERGALRLYFGASRAPFGVSKVMKNHPEMVSEAPKDDQTK